MTPILSNSSLSSLHSSYHLIKQLITVDSLKISLVAILPSESVICTKTLPIMLAHDVKIHRPNVRM